MAVVKCPKCEKEAIAKTKDCPNCNDPFILNSCGASNTVVIIVIAIAVLIGLIALTCAGL